MNYGAIIEKLEESNPTDTNLIQVKLYLLEVLKEVRELEEHRYMKALEDFIVQESKHADRVVEIFGKLKL